MSINSPCVKCELAGNANGLFTCNGCRQSFCLNHTTDHSNELRNRFEEILYHYNSIIEIFNDYKQRSNDLDQKITHKREKEINEIKLQINKSLTILSYSEKDLAKWMAQLLKLKVQLTNTNESNSFIKWINFFKIFLIILVLCCISFVWKKSDSLFPIITFGEVSGPVKLSGNQRVAEHNGPDFDPASFHINKIYSKDVYHVRLSFEQFSSSNTFIEIIQSASKPSISSSHDWFISNKPGEYQFFPILKNIWSFFSSNQPNRYSLYDVEQGDTIEIEIDCINSKVIFQNKRTLKKDELQIDLEQSPLPWQIKINFDRHGDRVRLH